MSAPGIPGALFFWVSSGNLDVSGDRLVAERGVDGEHASVALLVAGIEVGDTGSPRPLHGAVLEGASDAASPVGAINAGEAVHRRVLGAAGHLGDPNRLVAIQRHPDLLRRPAGNDETAPVLLEGDRRPVGMTGHVAGGCLVEAVQGAEKSFTRFQVGEGGDADAFRQEPLLQPDVPLEVGGGDVEAGEPVGDSGRPEAAALGEAAGGGEILTDVGEDPGDGLLPGEPVELLVEALTNAATPEAGVNLEERHAMAGIRAVKVLEQVEAADDDPIQVGGIAERRLIHLQPEAVLLDGEGGPVGVDVVVNGDAGNVVFRHGRPDDEAHFCFLVFPSRS